MATRTVCELRAAAQGQRHGPQCRRRSSSQTTYYYGEAYMPSCSWRQRHRDLNHLCYASVTARRLCQPNPRVAKTRVDGYGSGFIRGGASAVIAEGTRDIGYFINALFNGHMTVDAMWKAIHLQQQLISYASSRSAGYTSELDPNVQSRPTAAAAAAAAARRSTTARWSPSRRQPRTTSSTDTLSRSSARAGPTTRSPRWYAWSIRGTAPLGRWAD